MLAALVTLVGVTAHGNRIELKRDSGPSGEMVWASSSAFHLRLPANTGPQTSETAAESVALEVEETAGAIRVRSKFLAVSIQKSGAMVRVSKADGTPLMTDLTEARADGSGVTWSRELRAGARYYGMGPRADHEFDLRGKAVAPAEPFLYSTAGFGEYFPGRGEFRFDFTSTDRYRVTAPAVDYYFYYGPTIKQVFEEHNKVRGTAALWPVSAVKADRWERLRLALLQIVQGAISGAIAPTIDLGEYADASPELRERARQMASLVAEVSPGKVGLSEFRNQLNSFFDVYAYEAQEKGYPMWHPLPYQFPDDPECARHADEFLLGDEMLVAPIVTPGGSRSVYLPQGVWTNLETNEALPGRRTITVTTKSLPVFARNGTILPLDTAGGGLTLHYFPKLGAEFFLVEEDAWTQVHAAPAADVLRLEIESKKTREYRWVVHHADRPAFVGFEGTSFREAAHGDRTWSYDAKARNLEVRVRVAKGEDSIVNVTFE